MIQREGYPVEWLQELKDKNNIIEVVSRYVQLTPKSNRFWGCCPFHHEKTPSFAVNEQGFYYCFGCHESGDVITFIQKIEGMTFAEAVQLLAERAGMTMPNLVDVTKAQAKKKNRDRLIEINALAARHYHENLMGAAGDGARDYLTKRGIGRNLIVRFGLGYSVGFDEIIAYLKEKGFTEDEIVDSGVGWRSERSPKPFDALKERLIIPIINGQDKVIAFSGRVLTKEYAGGKYLNSRNTLLFEKNKAVYGINFAKREKRAHGLDKVIIVEGYMDVIGLAKHGINYAVAGMGTALGNGQAREIKGLSDNIYVCYDGDKAGEHAALANLEILYGEGVNLHIVSLPEGLDPDEVVRKYGREGFDKALSAALPYMEYRLKVIADKHNISSQTGRANYVKEALDFVKSVPEQAQQEVYLEIIHDKSRVATNILRDGLTREISASVFEPPTADLSVIEKSAVTTAGRYVLSCLLSGARYASIDSLSEDIFPDATQKKVFDYICDEVRNGSKPVSHMLYTVIPKNDGSTEDADTVAELAEIVNSTVTFSDEDKLVKFYNDSVFRLKNAFANAKIKELSLKFDAAQDDERRAVFAELFKYQQMLKDLKSMQ